MRWTETGRGNYAQSPVPVGCVAVCFGVALLGAVAVLAVLLAWYR